MAIKKKEEVLGITIENFSEFFGSGHNARHKTLVGPVSLHRFGSVDFRKPTYWFDQDLYLEAHAFANRALKSGGSHGDAFRYYIRNKCAVSLDWNDLTKLYSLHVPDGVKVDAFVSTVKAQPRVAEQIGGKYDGKDNGSKRLYTEVLLGGGTQYWLFPVPDWIKVHPTFLKGG